MMVSFCAVLFPTSVLGEILNLIESVSEGFPSYFCSMAHPVLLVTAFMHPYLAIITAITLHIVLPFSNEKSRCFSVWIIILEDFKGSVIN